MNSCLPSWAGSPAGEDGPATWPWIGPTTCLAPVTQCAVAAMARTPARVIRESDDGQGALAGQRFDR